MEPGEVMESEKAIDKISELEENLSKGYSIPSRECIHQMLRAQVAFRRALQRSVKRHHFGITFEMFQVLSILWYEEGITQQKLAERTVKNKASLTSLINNLEKKELVKRKEGDNDRRSKLVFLTKKGKELKKEIMPAVYEVYIQIEKEMGNKHLKELLVLLNDMEKALNDY